MPDTTQQRGPLAAACPACLAPPGQPCIATSSDLPRQHPHRLRGLATATQLTRCDTCGGGGWEPTGGGPTPANLTVCPVCAAEPFTACTEGGQARGEFHEVRNRAAGAGLGPCGTCDGIGWQPEPVDPDECQLVEIDGETVRLRGEERPLSDEGRKALSSVIHAARQRLEAEKAAERADIERQVLERKAAQLETYLTGNNPDWDRAIEQVIKDLRAPAEPDEIAQGGGDG